MADKEATSHYNSTGQEFAGNQWLDAHFLSMQPEYEEMLRWVGIEPGWHVLDAACGSGSFLPLLTELTGSSGQVSAIDIAPENVAVVAERVKASDWPAPVTLRVGDVLDLPYEDDTFDAVWCANITQYFTDDELQTMLSEFCRVVRPGGLVAIKEYDITAQQVQPTSGQLFAHWQDAMVQSGSEYYKQLFRVINLSQWLRQAGLLDIRQKPTFMVRLAPLREIERTFMVDLLTSFSAMALALDLPQDEQKIWKALAAVDSPSHILYHPDFQYRTVQTVFMGRVP